MKDIVTTKNRHKKSVTCISATLMLGTFKTVLFIRLVN